MSQYGAAFDGLAARWAALENEHDEVHPDRAECGSGGGTCAIMEQAVNLRQRMTEALERWRTTRRHVGMRRTPGAPQ